MSRIIVLFLFALAFSNVVFSQQMSDDQVVKYVKSAQQMGKSQKDITSELMRRGVTKEQVERIQKKYDDSQLDNQKNTNFDTSRSRQRGNNSSLDSDRKQPQTQERDGQKGLRGSNRTTDRLQNANGKLNTDDEELERSLSEDKGSRDKKDPTEQIFGHNIFTNENLTFEPNVNVATPVNYRLGPGDEVIIDVWGASETTIRQTISQKEVFLLIIWDRYILMARQ